MLLRYLRFLLKSAEESISKQPTLVELQNEATMTKTVVKAMQTELSTTKHKQALDRATIAEEKDGRLNET